MGIATARIASIFNDFDRLPHHHLQNVTLISHDTILTFWDKMLTVSPRFTKHTITIVDGTPIIFDYRCIASD